MRAGPVPCGPVRSQPLLKPTVHDIAREAGVSLATVDRVLNARPGVRDKTVARVQSAILSLGYVRDMSAANLARQRHYRFAFVLPDTTAPFVAALRAAMDEATGGQVADRVGISILPVAAHDPHAVARALLDLGEQKYSGVAVMAPETPQLRDAVARLKAQRVALVAFVSDLPNSGPDHFVGINNVAAGRTAGQLMHRFVRGGGASVLVVASSMIARDSLERRLGFDAVMRESAPAIRVLPSVETHDDPARLAASVGAAFRRHPDIAGVYAMAQDNGVLVDHLRATGALEGRAVIVHELTPDTRAALLSDEIEAVITQDVGHLVRSALRILRAKCDGIGIIPSQERIRVEIMMKENLPAG